MMIQKFAQLINPDQKGKKNDYRNTSKGYPPSLSRQGFCYISHNKENFESYNFYWVPFGWYRGQSL